MRPAIVAEKAGIPSVAIIAKNFTSIARLLGRVEGVTQRVAEYPGAILNHTEAEIRENIEKVTAPQIIEALTKPIEKIEVNAEMGAGSRDIVFTGSLEEVNRFFDEKGWSDGLTITPPTIERVESFLKYTDLSPHEEIAILPPANLRATPWNIAINGVMAGCHPEYMPLLVAAVEAIGDPAYNLTNLGTTAAMLPFLFIGGPIVKQLRIEYGQGAISRGPNPALGRALGLIVKNLAGFKFGETYMGTYGYTLPFVLAEDEDAIYEMGWKPIHVRQGFDKNANTVTARGTMNWGMQAFPSTAEPEGLLNCLCDEVVRQGCPHLMLMFGPRQGMSVLINPSVAKVIAHGGYSQEDVEAYLFENSRVTKRELDFALQYCDGGGVGRTVKMLATELFSFIPKEWVALRPDDTVPAMGHPGLIYVSVCGDPNRNKVMALYSLYISPQTKEVKLPANWDILMQQRGYPKLESFYR